MKHRSLFLAVALISNTILSSCLFGDDDPQAESGGGLTPPRAITNPKNDDEYFFNYRLTHFAPDTEPLIKATFGSSLMFEDVGFWAHTAYTSHVVGFTTNLPALSIVEYGETKGYGQTTVQSESYFYQHLHYLKGLKPNTTYHYRLNVQDYDGISIVSADHTFTTRELSADVIRIPEDMEGDAPYTLTTSNAKYVLTRDLTVPTLAINIKAHNIELELDGHTIIYDDGTPKVIAPGGLDYAYNEESTFGIRTGLWNFTNVKVLNGTIKQGRNGGTGHVGDGFNPLYLYHMGNTYNEVAGITVDYYGDNVCGMKTADGHIHHNVLYDRGSAIDDRHGGIRAIAAGAKPENDISFNSLRRFRHRGIAGCGTFDHNEFYSDSFATNSFILALGDDTQATNNKIFGMGYNPLGFGWGNDIRVANNFVYLRGFSPSQRSEEYSRASAVAGMRVTNYYGTPLENMLFEDNVIVLKAENGCTGACGFWTDNSDHTNNLVYRRNTVKVEAMPGNNNNPQEGNTGKYYNDEVNYALTALALCGGPGDGSESRPSPILFEDNHFIGNVNLITLGHGYGIGNSAWIYRTKLEKIEHDSEFFRPVRLGFWYWNTLNNRIIDSEYIGFDESEMTPYFYGSTGKMEMQYGETKTLTLTNGNGAPLANRLVTLTVSEDRDYTQTFQTDASGKATFDLMNVRHFKFGNSREHDGIAGTPTRVDYRNFVLAIQGYKPYSIGIGQLQNAEKIPLSPL